MRLRGKNNSATVAFAAVAFVLMGCVVAVCGAVAGFDASDLKFGITAYLCLAGLFFLASLSGVGLSKHKSFRVAPPAYLEGKRVKRRLWWLANVGSTVAMAALIVAMVGVVLAIARFE